MASDPTPVASTPPRRPETVAEWELEQEQQEPIDITESQGEVVADAHLPVAANEKSPSDDMGGESAEESDDGPYAKILALNFPEMRKRSVEEVYADIESIGDVVDAKSVFGAMIRSAPDFKAGPDFKCVKRRFRIFFEVEEFWAKGSAKGSSSD